MEPLKNSTEKPNKSALKIVGGLSCLAVCVILATILFNKKSEQVQPLVVMQPAALSPADLEGTKNSSAGDLQQRLADLQHLQQNYKSAVATGKNRSELQTLRTDLLISEEAIRASLDSIWVSAIANRDTDSMQLKNIASFRNVFDSVRMINSSSTTATTDEDFVTDKDAFIKLRNELMDKTNKIALLESSVEIMSKQLSATGSGPNANNADEAQSARAALLENKVNELSSSNMRLQQEVERLRKQPTEVSKNNSAEQILLSKNTSLQQKVNAINAELQLVRVDCNLSRVDATQIISNSKQRKQLLSEASGILTDLSTSSGR